MTAPLPIHVEDLSHRYADRLALDSVSLHVRPGEVFALLGPNGGGKTTLFRVLCTMLRPTAGRAAILGCNVIEQPDLVRQMIGVVFQSPSLDGKLTVRENLLHQGHLYGLAGRPLRTRIDELLTRFRIADRNGHRIETLSGGLARRVDLIRGLLHRPRVLLLDEPSSGLDPQARWEFRQHLDLARQEQDLSVLMTTHFMDEADHCDRVAILDRGHLVVTGSPADLKQALAGDCLTVETDDPTALAENIARQFQIAATLTDGRVRIEHAQAHTLIRDLVEAFPDAVRSVALNRPSLEEVFIHHTGHSFTPNA